MRRHIALSVTLRAEVIGGEEYIPDSTAATEDIVITIPVMDSKFFVFPKILEGATQSVVKQLEGNVGAYLDKKRAEERKRKEFEQMQLAYPNGVPNTDPGEWEGDEPMTDDSADSEDEEDAGDEDDDNPFDDEATPIGIDFSKIAKDAEAALRADGVDVEANHIPATAE